MTRKDKILVAVFGLTAVAGFGSGVCRLAHHAQHHQHRRAAFEQRVADVCVDAARRAERAEAQAEAPPARRAERRPASE